MYLGFPKASLVDCLFSYISHNFERYGFFCIENEDTERSKKKTFDLVQWFPTGEEFLPREEFYNFKGGILQILLCEGQWCVSTASRGCLLFSVCKFIANAILVRLSMFVVLQISGKAKFIITVTS